ncbi:MAG: manganese-binding transcriptional regulator MntR [Armatimonadetes bacterium]|nr:manganese-binding transcriptional regulator MntR [Armatimonadota bacterium]
MTIEKPQNELAQNFAQTREAHRTELAEDYVEVILDLSDEHGEARLVDIAKRLGVAHPTVSKALKKLEQEGLVVLKPYRALKLTDEGEELAKRCRQRHQTVVAFLLALGVDPITAEIEAEGIEHHVGEGTLGLMARFTDERSH